MIVTQVAVLQNLDLPLEDDEHIVGSVALPEERLSRRNPPRLERLRKVLEDLVTKRAEETYLAQLFHSGFGVGIAPPRGRLCAHHDSLRSTLAGLRDECGGPIQDVLFTGLGCSEVFGENDTPTPWPGIVIHLTRVPPESEVECFAPLVTERCDGLDPLRARSSAGLDERGVEHTTHPSTTILRVDADEVDVAGPHRLVGDEPEEEADH